MQVINIFVRMLAMKSGFLGLLLVTGCASLRTSPDPIISLSDNLALVKTVPMVASVQKFDSGVGMPVGMEKKDYRNMVLTIYLNAIDSQYQRFRTEVSGESHGANFGVDLAIIGLTSGASFASKAVANQLSAVASVFAGAKGSFDKNFYFDKTLPALLSAMDASRLKVRTRIVENMRIDETQYPLSSAFADVNEYQMAATLDRAIEEITSNASAKRESAVVALADAVRACNSDEDMADVNDEFRQKLFELKVNVTKDETDLRMIAGMIGADAKAPTDKLHQVIIRKMATNQCSISGLRQLMTEINGKAGRSIF